MMMKLQIELKGFTPLLDKLVKDYGVITAAVYGIVWRYAQMDDKVCRASLEKIADRINISSKTAERHIKKLCTSGYLEDLTPQVKNKPHIYIVTGKAELAGFVSSEIRSDRESDLDQLGQTESLSRSDRESDPGQTESLLKKQSKIHTKKQSPNGGNGLSTNGQNKPTNNKQPTKPQLTTQEKDELLFFGKHPDTQTNAQFDTIQEITNAGWNIREPIILQGVAHYIEAVRAKHPNFGVPNNTSIRKNWYKAIKGHLDDYRIDNLPWLYQQAIERHVEKRLKYSRPGSLTNTLTDVNLDSPDANGVVAWM
jgi:DNA-binding MarR family transcriptional regulator